MVLFFFYSNITIIFYNIKISKFRFFSNIISSSHKLDLIKERMSLYRFPTEVQTFEKVSSQHQLKEKLIAETIASGMSYINNHMRYINIMEYEGKYVYARCLYKSKQCPWRLFYRRKVYKDQRFEQDLQSWNQSTDCYFITIRFSNLFHNHLPFDDAIPLQKNPPNFISIWTNLHKYINFTTLQIHKYSRDYGRLFPVPGSISRRRSNQVDVYLNNLSFDKWVKNIKAAINLDVLYFPSEPNKQPQIAILTARKSFEISAWHGQVIGIKKVDPKILQYSEHYYSYKSLVFYQFIPGWKRIAYMFGLYSQGNYQKSKVVKFHKIFHMSNPDYTESSPNPEFRKSKINSNIYKIIKIFLKVLGSKVRTLVIDYDQQMIDVVDCIVSEINAENSHPYKLHWLVDPTFYFADITCTSDRFCGTIVHNLMKTCSQFQYKQLFKQYWDSIDQKQGDVKAIIEHFHLHHRSLLPFARQEPVYTGGWFQHSIAHQKCLQLLIERQKSKRPMVAVLDSLARYMVDEVKTYQHRPTMILNMFYEKAYPFPYLKQARINMMKKGFFLLLSQSLQVNSINFVNPGDTVLTKTKYIISLEQQVDEVFKDEYQFEKMSLKFLKAQELRSKKQKKKQELQEQVYDSVSVQVNSIAQQQSKFSEDRFLKYDKLFPLQPSTLIKTTTPLPPYLEIEDKGHIYICKLIIHSQQWFQDYANSNYICTKVDSSYYRVQYRCSCGFRQIKGVPCRHILKICIKHDLAVYPYVESYWKFKQSKAQWTHIKYMMIGAPVPHVGRPKLSHRRNRKRYSPGINLFEGYYCEGQTLQIK